jgi:hypothetical protein
MPSHSTHLKITATLSDWRDRLLKAPWYPNQQDAALLGSIYDRWDAQLGKAVRDLRRIVDRIGRPAASWVNEIMSVFGDHLGGDAITAGLDVRTPLVSVWQQSKLRTEKHFVKVGGKLYTQKDASTFGILFGITESHALSALEEFLTLSAGGFWEDEMSDSVRAELTSFFEGTDGMTRQMLTDKLETIVNDRLASTGSTSLPRSYFEGLSQHYIVQTRSAAQIFKGKELGATGYRLVNPAPKTDVCISLTSSNEVIPFEKATSELASILSASGLKDLKTKAPFNAKVQSRNTPPFHWRCKTAMENVYKGLND